LSTTSGLGKAVRDARNTSSKSFGGAIRLALRLTKRSITIATAKSEQRINGAMGQPAAWMIENKELSVKIK
jgi:hypothetical protein